MENNGNKNDFTYTYSAKERAEVKKIREKYAPPTEDEDKLSRLRRLDASVTSTAQAIALVFGVIGALILGFGMSLFMSDFGDNIGLNKESAMIVGIVAGIIGGVLASFAYPVYNAIVKAKRTKLAPEIIRLTDELMK